MSRAKVALSSSFTMAFPPYLMTKVFPKNRRMYGNASRSTSAFSIIGCIGLLLARSGAFLTAPLRGKVRVLARVPDGPGAAPPSLPATIVDSAKLKRASRGGAERRKRRGPGSRFYRM